jgi:hypothetical protein
MLKNRGVDPLKADDIAEHILRLASDGSTSAEIRSAIIQSILKKEYSVLVDLKLAFPPDAASQISGI